MEANYKQSCDFNVDILGETWKITGCWKLRYDDSVAWWDGETIRGGVKFHRIFGKSDIVPPFVEQVKS
jgi:hypothetical protein